jgi:hypothetical protein
MGRKAKVDVAMIKRVIIDWVDEHERFPKLKTRPTRQFEMLLASKYNEIIQSEFHMLYSRFLRDLALVVYKNGICDAPNEVIRHLRHHELHNECYWEDKL